MKPISTLMRPLRTVDMTTGEPADAVRERSDVCAVPAAGVVGEQMAAFVLAGEFQRVCRTVDEFVAAADRYRSASPTDPGDDPMAGGDDGRRKNQRWAAGR